MRALPTSLLVLLAGCAGQARPFVAALPEAPLLAEPGVHPFVLQVGGAEANGLLGVPASGQSATLVVLAKGLGMDAGSWQPLMEELSARGALSVAMEYRGAPGSWKVRAAVEDTLAAALAVRQAHPEVQRVILYGMSMGGEVSGLVLARAPPGTFTHWLVGAGVMDLRSEWEEAVTFQPLIEAEAGGAPWQAPGAYAGLSPIDQVDAIAAHGLKRAYLVHGAVDTVVPVEQAERMAQALAKAGVPVSYTVVASEPGAWACTPLVVACTPSPLPAGPANHEAGLSKVPLDILRGLVKGGADDGPATQRSVVEGWTGVRVALDVPTSQTLPASSPPA
ncbi:MAG: prolyl oligopeptidase family serine peptidase [Halobacteriales archaeon]|nr:prolyl oligopeptidase family serine peptidase [Halobacteriales archaeon]